MANASSTRKRTWHYEILLSLLSLAVLVRVTYPMARTVPTLVGMRRRTDYPGGVRGPVETGGDETVVVCRERCCSARTGRMVRALRQGGAGNVRVLHQCLREEYLHVGEGTDATYCAFGLGGCVRAVAQQLGRRCVVTTDGFAGSTRRAVDGLRGLRLGKRELRDGMVGARVWNGWDEAQTGLKRCFVDGEPGHGVACALVCWDDSAAFGGRVCVVEMVGVGGLEIGVVKLTGVDGLRGDADGFLVDVGGRVAEDLMTEEFGGRV